MLMATLESALSLREDAHQGTLNVTEDGVEFEPIPEYKEEIERLFASFWCGFQRLASECSEYVNAEQVW